MSRLQELRAKNKRKDLLFVGMGKTTVDMPENQKQEDLRVYNNFVKPLKNKNFNKLLDKVK